MIALIFSAFVLGALGSVHCVGMCGPLALSLPVVNKGKNTKNISVLLYNSGRAVTYSFFGLLFGAIGKTFALFGFQQWISISLGAIIILFLLVPKKNKFFESTNIAVHFLYKIRSSLSKLFKKRNYKSVFFIGLLNGLLPCGLVYMAVAGAIATASLWKSSLFMAFFGLGTFPLMLGVSFFGGFISLATRQKIRAAYPLLMFIIACLLIFRGLGLGIPYLSPSGIGHSSSAILCH
ncbi:MAG TPA: sulfite exporter TauE/SafE family protein [Hanamia sp.]|nr:sulfite exporter TauE/SafE family protein [Hanamia sp.]